MVSVVEIMNQRPYSDAWSDYKKLRNRVVVWTLLFMFLPLSVAYVTARMFGSAIPGLVLAFIAMGGWFFSAWQFQTWTCPQCGETFGAPLWRRCRHCGLPKWSENLDHSDNR